MIEEKLPPKNDTNKPDTRSTMLTGMGCLYSIFTLFSIAIILFILNNQFGNQSKILRESGKQYVYYNDIVDASRGDILSDDGRILLTSIPYYELRMDFAAPGLTDERFNDNLYALSDSLSSFFGNATPSEYRHKLREARSQGKRYFRIAPRRVDYIELQRIEEFPLFNLGVLRSGFIAEKYYVRERPFNSLASRVVGFINQKGTKVGLEGYFDDVLRGVDGLVVKQKISGDFWIPTQSPYNVEPIDGLDVQTTIDVEMQDLTEVALKQKMEELNAIWGTVVVMEVETGDIKVMANYGRDSLNRVVQNYNHAVGTSLEPGSTFKLPVLVTLLENTNLTLGTIFDTGNGKANYGKDANVTDSRNGGYGILSLQGVFEHSSNIGMVDAVRSQYRASPTQFIDDLKATGIGDKLGLQLIGEPTPIIKDPRIKDNRNPNSGWDNTSLIRMSQGYAVRLTPLQTLTYYNAVANDGRMVAPRLVSSLLRKGEVVQEFPIRVLNEQIASDKVINDVQKALKGVVERGTAQSIKNPLYSIAAKTGTAQIAIGRSGYKTADGSRYYLGSMAGYFPADNPKYSIIVAFQTFYKQGSNSKYYGSSVGAPLFKEITDAIYTRSYDFMEKHSSTSSEVSLPPANSPLPKVTLDSLGTPNVIGLGFRNATDILEQNGYRVKSQGYGSVKSQKLDAQNNTVIITLQ